VDGSRDNRNITDVKGRTETHKVRDASKEGTLAHRQYWHLLQCRDTRNWSRDSKTCMDANTFSMFREIPNQVSRTAKNSLKKTKK
jgi:hypothetical protein